MSSDEQGGGGGTDGEHDHENEKPEEAAQQSAEDPPPNDPSNETVPPPNGENDVDDGTVVKKENDANEDGGDDEGAGAAEGKEGKENPDNATDPVAEDGGGPKPPKQAPSPKTKERNTSSLQDMLDAQRALGATRGGNGRAIPGSLSKRRQGTGVSGTASDDGSVYSRTGSTGSGERSTFTQIDTPSTPTPGGGLRRYASIQTPAEVTQATLNLIRREASERESNLISVFDAKMLVLLNGVGDVMDKKIKKINERLDRETTDSSASIKSVGPMTVLTRSMEPIDIDFSDTSIIDYNSHVCQFLA